MFYLYSFQAAPPDGWPEGRRTQETTLIWANILGGGAKPDQGWVNIDGPNQVWEEKK